MHRISLGKLGEVQRITSLLVLNRLQDAELMIKQIQTKDNQIQDCQLQSLAYEIIPESDLFVSHSSSKQVQSEELNHNLSANLTESSMQVVKMIEQETPPPADLTLQLVKEAEERYKKMKQDEQASEELAMKLMLEENLKTQEVKLPAKPVAKLPPKPICATCRMEMNGQYSILHSCNHHFHTDCIRETVKILIEAEELNMKCPAPNCTSSISTEDFHSISTAAMRKEYKRIVDESKIKFIECPSDRCNHRFKSYPGAKVLKCPKCQISYCAGCLTSVHPRMTCQQKLESMFGNEYYPPQPAIPDHSHAQGSMKCPACSRFVYIYDQQRYLSCYCGLTFCRTCSQNYGNCTCYYCRGCRRQPCVCYPIRYYP